MDPQLLRPMTVGPPGKEVPLVCPETHRPLFASGKDAVTLDADGAVLRRWTRWNDFLNLIIGGRFEDISDEEGRRYETESNTYSTLHYWIPLFQELFPDHNRRVVTILSVGCGIGVEVDLLWKAGFACFGVDNGDRTVDWPKREHPDTLLLANGMHLPVADGTFDAVFCGCVFPHVGVVGDSSTLTDHCWQDRQRLASEMVRVTRRGGYVIACSPNRRFPFDIFHWRKPGCYRAKFNPPWSRFLLSVSDFRSLFHSAGGRDVRALPIAGFWGFVTMRQSLKGRLLSLPLRWVFQLASLPAIGVVFRGSPLVPWITVRCRV
jgi:SAM-dependent methyltransferase